MSKYEQELRNSENNWSEDEIQFLLSIFLHCPEDDAEKENAKCEC